MFVKELRRHKKDLKKETDTNYSFKEATKNV